MGEICVFHISPHSFPPRILKAIQIVDRLNVHYGTLRFQPFWSANIRTGHQRSITTPAKTQVLYLRNDPSTILSAETFNLVCKLCYYVCQIQFVNICGHWRNEESCRGKLYVGFFGSSSIKFDFHFEEILVDLILISGRFKCYHDILFMLSYEIIDIDVLSGTTPRAIADHSIQTVATDVGRIPTLTCLTDVGICIGIQSIR